MNNLNFGLTIQGSRRGNYISGFTPIKFNVADGDSSTALSVTTSSGLSTWRFYNNDVLEAEYTGTNSVNHTWSGAGGRRFEFFPPDNDYTLVIGTLDWSGKRLVGDIPAEIVNLSDLTSLILSGNQITSIPPEIADLSNLLFLYLNGNQITSIPPEIGNMSNLDRLYLHINQITSISPEIGNMSNLDRLWLYTNQITSIPVEIGNLNNLSDLFLYNNQITSHNVTLYATGDNVDFQFQNNQLPTTDVDEILVAINDSGGNNLSVDISGGTNGAPSATGVAAANSIISRGGTVITN